MAQGLADKVYQSQSFIAGLRYKNPVFMCSFGKDSMVLLTLLREMGATLPILFHRDPWWPNKYTFADRIILEYGLEVHDYAPLFMTLWEGKETMAFTSNYQVGPHRESIMQVPKNIMPPERGKKYLCALKDILRRPTGGFNYPWDCALVGHKNTDKDSIAGEVPLNCDIKQGAGLTPDIAFPLRHWTDDDIWDYTEKMNIPVQEDRYDKILRKEREDKSNNSDYAHVCIACCDSRSKEKSVYCPKIGTEVSCVTSMVPYRKVESSYFGRANVAPAGV